MPKNPRLTKKDEIKTLLEEVFGSDDFGTYDEVATRFSEWDYGSPLGVLRYLKYYQDMAMIPRNLRPTAS